jgi:putative chitinase
VLLQGQFLRQGHQGPAVAELQRLLGLTPDGLFGPQTRTAVEAFQQSVQLAPTSEARGMVGKTTLRTLLSVKRPGSPLPTAGTGAGTGLTLAQLRAIMPRLSEALGTAYLPHLNAAMAAADISTTRRRAAFLAQLAHESGELRFWEELADGKAYEGRQSLGNTQPGDGPRYKGRGPIQLTGRANYRAAGQALGIDLEKSPERARDVDVGFRVAAWFWSSRGLNPLADAGDFREITRRINGGYNGLPQREAYYARALQVL